MGANTQNIVLRSEKLVLKRKMFTIVFLLLFKYFFLVINILLSKYVVDFG